MVQWLADSSEVEVRRALGAAIPDVAVEELTILPRHQQSDPAYWSSTAFVNGDLVVKFAWSRVRALRLHREGLLLERLAGRAPGLRLPVLVALHADPVVVVTEQLTGEPLSRDVASDLSGRALECVAEDLADFLLALHRLPVAEVLGGLAEVTPTAQSDTAMLRDRFGRLVDDERGRRVHGWCDWVDDVLAAPGPDALVHGDLHGHNQLWDLESGALVAVLDLEECGVGDPHFDFRYLPGASSSADLLLAVADTYQRRSDASLSLERIMAWHALTALGDALWRTEAGVDLPGGGDARTYVDEVHVRLRDVGITTSRPLARRPRHPE